MKNYLKFIVAVFGITLATFGSISSANAKKATDSLSDGGNVECKGSGDCGYTSDCEKIIGTQKSTK